ncbi:MAG TPA: AraC family transcriptional regulator, partial [Polyangiales bacterium]|nr:AraC family transcriptional regulator [Polyangiales bacterium]
TDLCFVSIRYPGTGQVTFPALGFYSISFRFEGCAWIHEEGWRRGVIAARAGGVFVQAPNLMLDYGWRERHVAWAMCVSQQEVERAAQETEVLDPRRIEVLSRAGEDRVAERLVRALGAHAQLDPHPGQALAAAALHKAMALHILSHYGVIRPRERKWDQKLSAHALRKAVAYLEDNLERPCQLDELAAVSGVSSFSITQQFRHTLGESPAQYLKRVRVERAKHLLLRTRSAGRVAEQLGFADNLSFSKIFQRFTGVSPEYFSLLHGRRLESRPVPSGRPS